MLARYTMYRGPRPPSDPLPDGIRKDTRRHTKHILRPGREMVQAYLDSPSDKAWREFRTAYTAMLVRRFREDSTPFDKLAELAMERDVFIGCSCPTTRNPKPDRCHTFLALEFMKRRYPSLRVEFPLLSE